VTISTLFIVSLATHRTIRLIMIDEGPFGVCQWLRGTFDPDGKTWVGRGLACPWCLSFYVGPALVYLARFDLGYVLVAGLAISSVVSLAMQYSGVLLQKLARR
jgi:hypothetical protein